MKRLIRKILKENIDFTTEVYCIMNQEENKIYNPIYNEYVDIETNLDKPINQKEIFFKTEEDAKRIVFSLMSERIRKEYGVPKIIRLYVKYLSDDRTSIDNIFNQLKESDDFDWIRDTKPPKGYGDPDKVLLTMGDWLPNYTRGKLIKVLQQHGYTWIGTSLSNPGNSLGYKTYGLLVNTRTKRLIRFFDSMQTHDQTTNDMLDLITRIPLEEFVKNLIINESEEDDFTWIEKTGLGKVDLRSCEPGDLLISRHGETLTYVRPLPEDNYMDHEVRYSNGSYGSRTHDGYVYRKKRMESDHDIIAIIKQK